MKRRPAPPTQRRRWATLALLLAPPLRSAALYLGDDGGGTVAWHACRVTTGPGALPCSIVEGLPFDKYVLPSQRRRWAALAPPRGWWSSTSVVTADRETVAWRACGIATGPAASPCHDANRAKFEKTPAATCLPNSRTCLADAIAALLPDGTGGDGTLSDTLFAGDGSPVCTSNSRCQPAHESSTTFGQVAQARARTKSSVAGPMVAIAPEARSLARGHAQGDGGG